MLFIIFSLGIGFLIQPWLSVSKPAFTPLKNKYTLPDVWMEKVEATFMNKEGQVLMKIHTPTLTHYAENDTTLFNKPEFLLYRQSATPWHIQAGIGSATQGMKNIRLSNTVTLHHPGDAIQPLTWVNTDKLIIYPHQKTAETAEEVTLIQPHFTMRGKGLEANLNTGEMTLLSNTRGDYAINY